MKLKLDEHGNVVTQEVNGERRPVYIDDDGSEIAFDAPGTRKAIASRNEEAKSFRTRAETAEAKLAKFNDMDPEAAAKALETVSKLDQKKLIDAGKVDEVTNSLNKSWNDKLVAEKSRGDKLQNQLNDSLIGGSFARSKFISEKLAIPVDVVQAYFGKHFSLDENGKLVAKDGNGNVLRSKANPADVADFDEALTILVEANPNKASFYKGTQVGGGGGPNNDGNGNQNTGRRTMKRAEFDAIQNPSDKAKAARECQLVD